MKFKAALFYRGAIAYYNVYRIGPNAYKTKLDYYNGEKNPPLMIEIYKDGQRWNANCSEGELVNQLRAAIRQKVG